MDISNLQHAHLSTQSPASGRLRITTFNKALSFRGGDPPLVAVACCWYCCLPLDPTEAFGVFESLPGVLGVLVGGASPLGARRFAAAEGLLTAAEESEVEEEPRLMEAGLEGVLPPDFSASARSSFSVSSHKSIAE